jgi:hypothetical protein
MDNSSDASNSDSEELLPLVPNGNAAIDEDENQATNLKANLEKFWND